MAASILVARSKTVLDLIVECLLRLVTQSKALRHYFPPLKKPQKKIDKEFA